MDKFKQYFNSSKNTNTKSSMGYVEGQYKTDSAFTLTQNWESYQAGCEFILTEETSKTTPLKAGLGIFKATFKDNTGKVINVLGSKSKLHELFTFKPKPVQPEPQQPPAPVYIVEKQIVKADPEITKEFIEKIVEQMVLAGPQGQMGLRGPAGPPGPPGPPGPVVVAESAPASGVAGAQVSVFDFGGLQSEVNPSVSIDLGTI
jgi:hypothetical protein